MNCATENALNKYQEKLKKKELSYDDLDFSEEIENLLKDMI